MSDQYVYFIQADENGPIKIGFTSGDPQRRLNQLQTAHPAALRLIGAIKGTTAQERELHKRLSEWRLKGEWFEPHPSVMAVVQETLAGADDPHNHFHCSFCEKCQHSVIALIAGPDDIFICNECVKLCAEIVAEKVSEHFASLANSTAIITAETAGYGG